MALLDVVDLNKNKVGTIDVSDAIFAAPIRKHILTEVVHWHRACKRAGTQSALTKAEVNGSTKKPFPQKGRGQARQGSLKNPQMIGGGVAFAPKPRDYSYAMPKAKRRAALAVALSARVLEEGLVVVKDFALAEPKTRLAAQALTGLDSNSALVVDCENHELKRSLRNLSSAKFLDEKGLNVYDILRFPKLVMTERAVQNLQARLLGEGM